VEDEPSSVPFLQNLMDSQRVERDDLDVVYVTSNRFPPWNGLLIHDADHIWADLPALYEKNLLIYVENTTNGKLIAPESYEFGQVEIASSQRGDGVRTFFLVLYGAVLSLKYGPKLLLGFSPTTIFERFKYAVLRRGGALKISRYHRASVVLARTLRQRSPDLVIFHGEFDAWGTAIVWACRRARKPKCVAQQHYAMPLGTARYQNLERLGRYRPDGLLCISKHEETKWRNLPLPVGFGGSRRGLSGLDRISEGSTERLGELLILPSVGDTEQLQAEIVLRPDILFHVRPHPSRLDGWDLENVIVYEQGLTELFGRFDLVATSSPSPAVVLTALGQPFIKMRGKQADGSCDCSERRVFRSLTEILEVVESGESYYDLAVVGCEHNRTDPPPKESWIETLEGMLSRVDATSPIESPENLSGPGSRD